MSSPPTDVSLAQQCLTFCQMLTADGLTFNFSLKVDSFSFFLNARESRKLIEPTKNVRRISPSKQRRSERRRKEFLARKESSPATISPSTSVSLSTPSPCNIQ